MTTEVPIEIQAVQPLYVTLVAQSTSLRPSDLRGKEIICTSYVYWERFKKDLKENVHINLLV